MLEKLTPGLYDKAVEFWGFPINVIDSLAQKYDIYVLLNDREIIGSIMLDRDNDYVCIEMGYLSGYGAEILMKYSKFAEMNNLDFKVMVSHTLQPELFGIISRLPVLNRTKINPFAYIFDDLMPEQYSIEKLETIYV